MSVWQNVDPSHDTLERFDTEICNHGGYGKYELSGRMMRIGDGQIPKHGTVQDKKRYIKNIDKD